MGDSVACIGVGAMGEALIGGILQAGLVDRQRLFVSDADEARMHDVATKYGVQAASNQEVAAQASTIVIAVKPAVVPAVLQQIGSAMTADACVVSIAAGVPLSTIESCLPAGAAAIRAMPNTPCLVRDGAIALAAGRHATDAHMATARTLFEAVGKTVSVTEDLMDAVTGLSGSGPAYVYMFIEALADGGVHAGLPRDVALQLAAQTVLGAARMVLETGRHPGELKDMVTSPAGTTIAGVATLEDRGFRAACLRAVDAAARRSRQLGESTSREAGTNR